MLTPGNKKLGERLIWSFGLPSGTAEVCVGMSPLCQRHCYALRLERLRPAAKERYRRNFELSQQRDFGQRLRYFILDHDITVVRIHVGGDFYSPAYARQWLRVIRRLPQVAFFCYSRSWRLPSIHTVLEAMAELPNVRMWYSCDRDTGVPVALSPRIRLCWLSTEPQDVPAADVDLVFRIHRLRSAAQTRIGGIRVCPEEDGVQRRRRVTCDRCKLCWRPLPSDDHPAQRIALPQVQLTAPLEEGQGKVRPLARMETEERMERGFVRSESGPSWSRGFGGRDLTRGPGRVANIRR